MSLPRKFAAFAAGLFFAGSLAFPAVAQNSPDARAKALNDRVMCMCGGCNETAGKCNHMGGAFAGPCDVAQKEMKEISDRIAGGQSDDLVLQSFVQEYGPTVLISPGAGGFDFWAWAMPVVMPLLGIALVFFVVMRWRKRVALSGAPKISPELLARAQSEMDRRLDD
ncbi:MAG TPA: cytochrome c-type biogenesis protein CcmH [Candidatus Acidoferrales bacterium]|nr:cytochrome c-type biogenesis protein CcmH [Candidatus Acidoferrales bacterium]